MFEDEEQYPIYHSSSLKGRDKLQSLFVESRITPWYASAKEDKERLLSG